MTRPWSRSVGYRDPQLPAAGDYPTGPLDFQDVDRLRTDPYLRDAAGRFAPHPADQPRARMTVTTKRLVRMEYFGAGGGGMVGYEGSSHVAVPAPRCPHGHFARWAGRNCTGCRRR